MLTTDQEIHEQLEMKAGTTLIDGCSITGYEERRIVLPVHNDMGEIVNLKPDEDSYQAWIIVKLPNGVQIRAQVSRKDFEEEVFLLIRPNGPGIWEAR